MKAEDRKMEINNVSCSHCQDGYCDSRTTERDQSLKDNLITRLNRIEGQVRGIRGMVDKDAYCDDVLNQISAVQSALNSVSKLVLKNHISSCLVRKIRNGEDEIVDELLVTIGKLYK